MTSLHQSVALFGFIAAVASAAHAYDGVQPATTERVRDDVVREAVAVAAAPDPYKDSASSVVAAPMHTSLDRLAVEREAVIAAHAPHQNLEPGAFFNSVVPVQFDARSTDTRFADDSGSNANVRQGS